ncbi:MAG: hypothetical protein PHO48_02400 [Candidatus Gracilibacteria bacterium]|nr:hypothetical protein [Candidatus Gracilibacteria bacterium]MDD5179206.1 hypothetical protein [Candidatus Gracilibacteria bacterium]
MDERPKGNQGETDDLQLSREFTECIEGDDIAGALDVVSRMENTEAKDLLYYVIAQHQINTGKITEGIETMMMMISNIEVRDSSLYKILIKLLEAGNIDEAELVADKISYDNEKYRALHFIALKRVEAGDADGTKRTLQKIQDWYWRSPALAEAISKLAIGDVTKYIEEIIPETGERRAFLQSLRQSDDVSPRVSETVGKSVAEIRQQARKSVSGKLKKKADR